jgi:hypothetical protein
MFSLELEVNLVVHDVDDAPNVSRAFAGRTVRPRGGWHDVADV